MSIQDIANYVRQTPGNTNPSVITSMVKSEVGEYIEEASNEALRKLGIKTDRKETWLLPEQSFVMEPIMDGAEEGMFGSTFTPVGKTLPEELCFVINGVVYKSKKQTMEHNADTVGWYGNAAHFSPDDFEETSEPFFALLALDDNSFSGGIINPDTGSLEHAGTTHTFGIYILEESITPISGKYLPKGGVGYTEPGKSITWDGNTDGKVVILDTIVQMSTEPIDLYSIKSISYTTFNGESHTVDVQHEAVKIETGGLLQVLTIADEPSVFVCLEDHRNNIFEEYFLKGTYFVKLPTNYTSAIQCAETVHPINPKYLPGICLPIVKLTTDIPIVGNDVEFTETEGALLAAAVTSEVPIIISCTFDSKPLVAIFNYSIDTDGTIVLFTKVAAYTLQILGFDDGVWVGELIGA